MRPHQSGEFTHIRQNTRRFTTDNLDYCLSPRGSVDFICRDCDFFKEDEVNLECNAFKILKRLLARKLVTPEDIIRAVQD